MAFGETNRVDLALGEETNFGEFPTGNLEKVRYTSESFGQDKQTQVSNEIRSDRQVPDVIRQGVSLTGGFSAELSYDVLAYEKLFKGLLGAASDFTSPPAAVTGTLSAAASNNQFSSSGMDFSGFTVGDWVRVSGMTNSSNNGYFQVTAVDNGSSPATLTVVGDTLTDETDTADASVQGSSVLRNGTTKHSFSFEKQFQDLNSGSGLAVRLLGYVVGGLSLSLDPRSIVTMQFSGQGKQATDTAGSDLTDSNATLDFTTLSTLNSASANEVMSTGSGIADIVLNRDEPFNNVTINSLSLNPQNNLRNRPALTSGLGVSDIGFGRFQPTGSMTAYFEDKTLLEQYLLHNKTDLAVAIKDGANNAYLIDIPAFYIGGDFIPKATGTDEDVTTGGDITPVRSTRNGLDYTMAVHKFASS